MSQGSAGNSAVYWVLRLAGAELHRNPIPTGGVTGAERWLPGLWLLGQTGWGREARSRAEPQPWCCTPGLHQAGAAPSPHPSPATPGKGQSCPQGETTHTWGRARQSRERGWGKAPTGRAPHGPWSSPRPWPDPLPAPPQEQQQGLQQQAGGVPQGERGQGPARPSPTSQPGGGALRRHTGSGGSPGTLPSQPVCLPGQVAVPDDGHALDNRQPVGTRDGINSHSRGDLELGPWLRSYLWLRGTK